jgi:hypothetical protein
VKQQVIYRTDYDLFTAVGMRSGHAGTRDPTSGDAAVAGQ